ncbi:hypothetical protein Peur_020185 [Populus x canadensis]
MPCSSTRSPLMTGPCGCPQLPLIIYLDNYLLVYTFYLFSVSNQGRDLEGVMSSAPGWIERCEIAVKGTGKT